MGKGRARRVEQCVRCAGIAVADDEAVDRRRVAQLFRQLDAAGVSALES